MGSTMLERELKRGSAELLILALLEDQERHGYDIGKQIEARSDGTITFHFSGHSSSSTGASFNNGPTQHFFQILG